MMRCFQQKLMVVQRSPKTLELDGGSIQQASSTCGVGSSCKTVPESCSFIHRGAFLVNRACRLLATDNESEARLEPVEHEWEEHFGTLRPSKCMERLPQNVVAICRRSGKCDTQRCGCRSAGVTCVIFCYGKKDNSTCINLPRKV